MSAYLKYVLLAVGGIGLFIGTYTTVAVFSGAPLHEVAGIGMFVEAPEGAEDGDAAEGVADATPEEPAEGAKVLEQNVGLLGTFMIDSPFNGAELRGLQDELKRKAKEHEIERQRLGLKALELEEWEARLKDQFAGLADRRTMLEELESSIALRMAELTRDESAKAEAEQKSWRDMAKLYAGGEAAANAFLIAEEDAEHAALILRALPEEEASAILQELQPAKRKEFMDAYRRAGTTPPPG